MAIIFPLNTYNFEVKRSRIQGRGLFALSPLQTCVDDAHPLRFATIEAGALLDRVLYDIGLIDPA